MYSIRAAGDRNWETKETRRRSAGSAAKVGALEELDERKIADALTDNRERNLDWGRVTAHSD